MHRLFAGLAIRAAIRRPAGKRHAGCLVGISEASRERKHGHCHGDQRDQNRAKNTHELDARSNPQGCSGQVTAR